MSYKSNVFINCPFDDDFYYLLKPILFTCVYCGLNPKLSETNDGDDIRVRQIQKLIEKSKYSIHDISRILPKAWKSKKKTKKTESDYLPRFNMPFELGLDIGCKHFAKKDKKCLILEEKPYRYKAVISDIAGQDISSHDNDPIRLIKVVRNWIYNLNSKSKPDSYRVIWDLYNEFIYDFNSTLSNVGVDSNKMWEIPFSEVIDYMNSWIKEKRISLDR